MKEESTDIVAYCTLSEMIDKDLLDNGYLGRAPTTDGFTIGKKGKIKFYMWDPTPNGYYKLYIQDENGTVTGTKYVDALKVFVTVWKAKI